MMWQRNTVVYKTRRYFCSHKQSRKAQLVIHRALRHILQKNYGILLTKAKYITGAGGRDGIRVGSCWER